MAETTPDYSKYYEEIKSILAANSISCYDAKGWDNVPVLEVREVFFLTLRAMRIEELLKNFTVPVRVTEMPNQDKIIIRII
jgi:hypothetical protein